MIKKPNISRHNLHLFFGIILSVFVLVQSSVVAPLPTENQEQTDQKETEKEPTATVSKAQAIANSLSQINVSFDSYLLDVLTFTEAVDAKKSEYNLVVSGVNNAVRVLFGKIISPNAP